MILLASAMTSSLVDFAVLCAIYLSLLYDLQLNQMRSNIVKASITFCILIIFSALGALIMGIKFVGSQRLILQVDIKIHIL